MRAFVFAFATILSGCENNEFSITKYTDINGNYEYVCQKLTPLFRRDVNIARCKTSEECEVKCSAARSEWEKGRK